MPNSSPVPVGMGRMALTFLTTLSSVAALTSSADESSFLCWPDLRGKRIKRALYDLRRATLALRDSCEWFVRRGSTEIPIVGASLRAIPASCILR